MPSSSGRLATALCCCVTASVGSYFLILYVARQRKRRRSDDCCSADQDLPSANTVPRVYAPAESELEGEVAVDDSWDDQVAAERQALEVAVELLRGVRLSSVRVPHFHIVEKQLKLIENHLDEFSQNIQGFWRYGRDEPLAQLLALPFMQLATVVAEDGAVLPVSQGFVKEIQDAACEDGSTELQRALEHSQDCVSLGIGEHAGPVDVESAYRRGSRRFHRMGRCINVTGFDQFTRARNRLLARLSPSLRTFYEHGTDLLAHYLLLGTDPSASCHRERSQAILDARHRTALLYILTVLQWSSWDIPLTWGDEADCLTLEAGNAHSVSGFGVAMRSQWEAMAMTTGIQS